MRNSSRLFLCVLAGSAAARAWAQDPAEATTESAGAVLLPFQLAADTEGTSKLSLGLGYLFRLGKFSDLAATISAEVATSKGLIDLLSVTGDGVSEARPWKLGGTISYAHLAEDSRGYDANRDEVALAKEGAFAACKVRCSNATATGDKPFCDLVKKAEDELTKWFEEQSLTLAAERFCRAEIDKINALGNGPFRADDPAAKPALEARRKALQACHDQCAAAPNPEDPFCTLLGKPAQRRPGNVSTPDLCPLGRSLVENVVEDLQIISRYPELMIDAGGRIGRETFEFRRPSEQDPMLLVADKSTKTRSTVGLSAVFLPVRSNTSMSLELLALYDSDWTASATSIRSCTPKGQVPRMDPPGPPPVAADPAETCSDAKLGAPSRSEKIQIAVLAGAVSEVDERWRVSFGPDLVFYPDSASKTKSELSLSLPVYLNLAGTGGKYKGVLRIAPQIGVKVMRDDSSEWFGKIAIAILGERSLFSSEFDQL